MGKARLFSQLIAGNGTIKATKLGADVPITENVATADNLPSSASIGEQAFVEDTNRLYIWNGSGWYNIALINTSPTWDSNGQPLSSYTLDADSPQDATTITLAASDPDGLPIQYSYVTAGSMDSMANISQDSSVFTITPKTVAQVGEGVSLTGSITFRASDGVNILPSVSSFTLNFITIIENSRYTTLLATAVDTSDNNDITDSSTNNYTITVNGDAHAGTFSPYRHGGYSTYFDGTGDYIDAPSSHSSFALGTNDFTYECWFYPQNLTGCLVSKHSAGAPQWFELRVSNGYIYVGIAFSNSWGPMQTGTIPVPANKWCHVALVRNGSSFSVFVNGVLDTGISISNTGSISNNTSYPFRIGARGAADLPYNGYISDARLVNGTALYTSNFTPPTERLTAITNTSLLTCHLPYIADGSSNAHAITINGNTSTKPFSPYDNLEYAAADNGGSVYFDGTGDYLTAGSQANWKFLNDGSTDYTVEAWFYPTSTASRMEIISTNVNTVANGYGATFASSPNNDGAITYYIANGSDGQSFKITTDPNVITANAWNHVAVTLNVSGQELRVYVNGKLVKTENRWNINNTYYATTFNYGNANPNFTLNVGRWIGTVSGNGGYVNGNIQDLRITKSRVYTTDFTPPTAPLSTITNTDFLLSGTDASIIDKSQASNLKLVGNTTGSTTQVKFADTKSMYFDGTGDYVTISDLELSGDLTIEGWFYQSVAQSATFRCLTGSSTYTSPGSTPLRIYTNGSDVRAYVTSTTYISGSFTANSWFHVALVRSSGTWTLYIDGVSAGTSTTSGTYNFASTTDWYIGASGPDGYPFTGYSQDVRFSNGLARYTANFTPPTAPLKG